MDIKAYIESGAIEAYVLGLASAEEAAELVTLRKQYPELNDAIIAFEMQLENTAIAEAEAPPVAVKLQLDKLLANELTEDDDDEKAVVVPMTAAKGKPFWKYMAAASIILLMASAGLNFYLFDQYQTADTGYKKLLAQQNTLMADNNVMQTKLDVMNESLKIMTDPAMLAVSMPSVKAGETYRATVYWDTKTKDVYLLNNSLPQAPKGKQYQLWALVDGKPVDAGMMDVCSGVCHMKNIPAAQAFAITLENEGGRPQPTMEQLYVLGKI